MIRVIPATEEAVRAVYGEEPVRTMRGVAFERDGRILGCAGLYLEEGALVMFFNGDHETLKRAKRAIVKAYRILLAIAAERRLPVYAHADERYESSERFLEHMGFRRFDGRIFEWR